MRALRILIVLVVILGGLFVIADRVAVHYAENEVADRVKARENLAADPDVDIQGFPFLTQVASGSLDDVRIGIGHYTPPAGSGGEQIRVDDLDADMKDVTFSDGYSSATAAHATGTATIAYDQLQKAAKTQPTELQPGISAQILSLSYGGDGKIKAGVRFSVLGINVKVPVLSTVSVKDGKVEVHADALPAIAGADLADGTFRRITDFQQAIQQLPGGIRIDQVRAEQDGIHVTVKGSDVKLSG